MGTKNSSRFTPLIIAISVVAGILIGTFYAKHFAGNRLGIINGSSNKLNALLRVVDDQYVDSVDMTDLVEKAMPQILAELDPHSTYIPAQKLEEVNSELEGSFSGIGIQFTIQEDTIHVNSVIQGGPSEKVGLMAGDRIVMVNDSLFVGKGLTNEKAMRNLKGPKGTQVKLGVKRATEKELLEQAALAESFSSHPISKSLKNAYGKELDASNVSDVEEISGHGVTVKVNGRQVAAGNAKLMKSLNLAYTENTGVGTVVHVAVDGKYAGYILISDVIKDGAKEAIASLKNSGVKKCVMLTGDSKTVAEHVAGELKLDEVHSELLPADKVSCVEKLLQDKSEKEKLAFVGDGINDAPVLSRADIGIAMGALGSDAAIEAADVVLMDDNPAKIALAMRISRKCLRIVYENIVFALAVKAICLILGALGIANMWVAIFADVGVMVLAVLNAIRCLRIKNN